MYKNNFIAVVVPAYNEETQITEVINSIPRIVDKIIIVNDCSKDATSVIVRQHPEHSVGRVILLEHENNHGVGGAIATGYKWAKDNNCDVAVVMAGDGQMAPEDLTEILGPVVDGQADFAKGNRLITRDAFKKIPKIRFFGNLVLSILTKIASGYWRVADSQTGYTAINRFALEEINWNKMYKRYGQPNDLLVRLNVAEMRVVDVPIKPVYNVGEKSGIKIHKVIFTISWLLVCLFFWRLKEKYIIRNFHPLIFFYIFGFFAIFLSTILFFRILALWFFQGYIAEITFLSWLFSLSLGFNSLFFAMWFDYSENKHLNPILIRRKI